MGGGSWSPPYLSQPFMVRFSKFFFLVKACENRHWLLFHRWLSIIHHMAARRRRSDEGQSRQYFQGKNQISQFLSDINVIYLKRTHFSCRIQIQTKNIWVMIISSPVKGNHFNAILLGFWRGKVIPRAAGDSICQLKMKLVAYVHNKFNLCHLLTLPKDIFSKCDWKFEFN